MDLVSFGNKYWTISVPASSVNHLFKPRTFLLISWGLGIVFIAAYGSPASTLVFLFGYVN